MSLKSIIGIRNNLLLLTVFLLPLIGASNGFGFELIKVVFFIFAVSICIAFWLLDFKNHPIEWTFITKSSLAWILVLFFSSLLGINLTASFLGEAPYFQGFILYAYLFLFFLLVRKSKIKLEHWSFALFVSAVLISIIAIEDFILSNFLNFDIPNYAGRVISTFGQPNFYSGYVLMALPFALFLLQKKGWKYLSLLGIILMIAAIFISQSRAAIFLMTILFPLWLISFSKKIIWIVSLLGFIASFLLISQFIDTEILKPSLTNNPDLITTGVEKRIYIWPVMAKLILERPLTGFGLENIDKAFSGYFITNKHALFEENLNISPVLIGIKDLIIDRSHNYGIDLLLFSGIFGLLAWIFLVVSLFKNSRLKVLTFALLIYIVWVQFQNQSIAHLVYFFLVAGLLDREGLTRF